MDNDEEPAEGDRGNVGQEPQGDDFGQGPPPQRSDQLPEEQPKPMVPDDKS